MNKLRLVVLILIVAVAASIVGFFIYKDIRTTGEEINKVADKPSDETVKNQETQPTEVPLPKVTTPDLTKVVVITADLPEETKKQALKKIAELIDVLKTFPDQFGNWIELGSYMKLIGDYDRAIVYWKYAATINPKNFIPHANLGDLYLHNLKDVKRAEQSYKTALSVGPDQVMVYEKLAELYKYFLKDDTKAKAVLQEGIDKNPSTSDRLKYLLNNYENN